MYSADDEHQIQHHEFMILVSIVGDLFSSSHDLSVLNLMSSDVHAALSAWLWKLWFEAKRAEIKILQSHSCAFRWEEKRREERGNRIPSSGFYEKIPFRLMRDRLSRFTNASASNFLLERSPKVANLVSGICPCDPSNNCIPIKGLSRNEKRSKHLFSDGCSCNKLSRCVPAPG